MVTCRSLAWQRPSGTARTRYVFALPSTPTTPKKEQPSRTHVMGSCALQGGRSRLSWGPGPHSPSHPVWGTAPCPHCEAQAAPSPGPCAASHRPYGQVTEPMGSEGWGGVSLPGRWQDESKPQVPSPFSSSLTEPCPLQALVPPLNNTVAPPVCRDDQRGLPLPGTGRGRWLQGLLGKLGPPSSTRGPFYSSGSSSSP